MTDPLGSGTFTEAIGDISGLVTTSYVPGYVTAIVGAAALGIAFAWIGRAIGRFRGTK